LRRGIDLMFGVIEVRLRHPMIDQNRFRDCRDTVRGGFHFMTKCTAGKIHARGRVHILLRLVGILGEENCALELVTGMKLIAQLFDLLRDERRHFALWNCAFQTSVIGVLRGQTTQKRPDKIDIPVRNSQLRILRIELERMTSLTIVGKGNSLIQAAVRLRLMAIVAIELLAVHWRNIGCEMALVIEAQHVRIADIRAF